MYAQPACRKDYMLTLESSLTTLPNGYTLNKRRKHERIHDLYAVVKR